MHLVKMEKTGELKNYKKSLHLNENVTPSTKITSTFDTISSRKMTTINRTEPSWTYSPGGSKWASPILLLRKIETYVYVEIIE